MSSPERIDLICDFVTEVVAAPGMSVPSPNDYDEYNGEGTSDISDEYDTDVEGDMATFDECDTDVEELPDADEEGGSHGEDDYDGVDDSVHIFTGHTDELYTAACSPTDAALVATGGKDDKGFLWKINHGDWAFELQGHQDSVCSLSFSADGRFLASGSMDGVVKVWDIAMGGLKCTLEGVDGGIEWVRWHPTKHLVLAGLENSCVCMWDPDSAPYVNVLSGHASNVTCGDFTPDGRRICTGSQDATLRIWDLETSQVKVVKGHSYNSGGVACLTINSDSTLAFTGSTNGYVHVVNISTGQVVSSWIEHEGQVECAAFEPSSRRDSWRAATGGLDGKLIIWDNNSLPYKCYHELQESVTCLLWLSSTYIACGCDDGKIWIWNSVSGEPAKTFSGHSVAIQSITASCNGDFLVSVSYDGTARVFDIAEFK